MTKTVNFGLLNFTKPKKKPRNQKKKCHNIFTILFTSSCGRSRFDILLFYFWRPQQILSNKLLLILKLCIKKKKNKKATQENCAWNYEFWFSEFDKTKKEVKEYNKISQHLHNTFIFRIRYDILLLYFREMLHP